MKLVVMGAGYVGHRLLETLKNSPFEVYVTTTHPEKVNPLSLLSSRVLLLDKESDQMLLEWINQCDGLVVMVAPNVYSSYEETYLNTAKNISSMLKSRETKKPFQLIYTSSTSVCEGLTGWITEEMPLLPTSSNGKILLATEQCYLDCNASICILRLGGIYGPGRELIDRARRLSGKSIPGTGDEPTNNIHVEDIIRGILFSLDKNLTGVYHLVNDDHTSRKELYGRLCGSLHIPPPVWDGKINKSYLISNQKIKESGFSFQHPTL